MAKVICGIISLGFLASCASPGQSPEAPEENEATQWQENIDNAFLLDGPYHVIPMKKLKWTSTTTMPFPPHTDLTQVLNHLHTRGYELVTIWRMPGGMDFQRFKEVPPQDVAIFRKRAHQSKTVGEGAPPTRRED